MEPEDLNITEWLQHLDLPLPLTLLDDKIQWTVNHGNFSDAIALADTRPLEGVELELQNAAKAGDLPLIISLSGPFLCKRMLRVIASEAAEGNPGGAKILQWCFGKGFQLPVVCVNFPVWFRTLNRKGLRRGSTFDVLLKNGLQINGGHFTEWGGDALRYACEQGNLEGARFLLERGHTLDGEYSGGWDNESHVITAIGRFSISDEASEEIVSLLLRYGLVVCGSGIAIAAAEMGKLKILKLLVENGADLEKNLEWWDGCYKIRDLYHGEDIQRANERCGTALYRACRAGEVEVVDYLLKIGANGYAEDRHGCSCYRATRARITIGKQYEEVVSLLQESGIYEYYGRLLI